MGISICIRDQVEAHSEESLEKALLDEKFSDILKMMSEVGGRVIGISNGKREKVKFGPENDFPTVISQINEVFSRISELIAAE